jgi:hypothetical protein
LIPDPTGTSKRDFDHIPRPRIIKSHDCFDPRFPRVIYIVRDLRDVVLSQYHYHRKLKKIADDSPIETFVFLGKTASLEQIAQAVERSSADQMQTRTNADRPM